MSNQKLSADYAVRASKCKKCSQQLEKGTLRIAKLVENPFSEEGGEMKMYHHVDCLFDTFKRARATTKIIEETDDISNFSSLKKEDKDLISAKIREINEFRQGKAAPAKGSKQIKTSTDVDKPSHTKIAARKRSSSSKRDPSLTSTDSQSEDDEVHPLKFSEFCDLCDKLAMVSGHKDKTDIVRNFIKQQLLKRANEEELFLLIKSLLPGIASNVVYNMNSKQIVKHFSIIFNTSLPQMLEHLEKGDVSETISHYFTRSHFNNLKVSKLTLKEVDESLSKMADLTKDKEQLSALTAVAKKCTARDLKMFIRLIKKDLRINAGAKFILDGLTSNAYEAFKTSRDLRDVVHRSFQLLTAGDLKKSLSVKVSLMTPVAPMLAEPCRSVDLAFKRCPNGMYAEVKYDGERVQVHKRRHEFKFFSRSLKPVQTHKAKPFEQFLPQAFPTADDLIIDSEVLLIDKNTELPLPFGSLGVHKKTAYSDACICLYVFDCLYINGKSLLDTDMKKRRELLESHMKEIKYHIMFSKQEFVSDRNHLLRLIGNAIDEGLEGLVLKAADSMYEPGKRHWLKVKKDYLESGSMADSADLVVLGAYYGTGSKGGMMSVFLMGCYDEDNDVWCTVTKVGNGLTDSELNGLQKGAFDMIKIRKDMSLVPLWLNINRAYLPDFIVRDPKKSQVWEITGAEFSKSDAHTADGISIRFPRITRRRPDKDWKTATSLKYLHTLFEKSKTKGTFFGSSTSDTDGIKRKRPLGKSAKNKSTNAERRLKTKISKSTDTASESEDKSSDASDIEIKSPKPTRRKIDEDDKAKKTPCKFSVKLPNLFKNLTFYFSPSVNDKTKEKLKRYIIAYGGVVSTSQDKSDIHVVNSNEDKTRSPNKAKFLSVDDVWKSITEKRFTSN